MIDSCVFVLFGSAAALHSDYFNSTDLHIGVTTSTGIIVEFDRCGLKKNLDKGCKTLWAQSLLVESVPDAWLDHWDDTLTKVKLLTLSNQ